MIAQVSMLQTYATYEADVGKLFKQAKIIQTKYLHFFLLHQCIWIAPNTVWAASQEEKL